MAYIGLLSDKFDLRPRANPFWRRLRGVHVAPLADAEQGAADSDPLCPWNANEVWQGAFHRLRMGFGDSEITAP